MEDFYFCKKNGWWAKNVVLKEAAFYHLIWRHDTWHNNIQHNNIQHNIQHYTIQHNNSQYIAIQHNETQNREKVTLSINDGQHKNTQNPMTPCRVSCFLLKHWVSLYWVLWRPNFIAPFRHQVCPLWNQHSTIFSRKGMFRNFLFNFLTNLFLFTKFCN